VAVTNAISPFTVAPTGFQSFYRTRVP